MAGPVGAPITRLTHFPVTCHFAAGPGAPSEHRRAGSTVQDVDFGRSPCLPHDPAEHGANLLRVEGRAPGDVTAAYAGLDDALVVAETTHRAPPFFPVHLYRGARRPDLIHARPADVRLPAPGGPGSTAGGGPAGHADYVQYQYPGEGLVLVLRVAPGQPGGQGRYPASGGVPLPAQLGSHPPQP